MRPENAEAPSGEESRSTSPPLTRRSQDWGAARDPSENRGAATELHDRFTPAFGLGGAFRQTVLGALLPVRYPAALPPAVRQEVALDGSASLSVFVTPSRARARGRLLLFHGLGGSAMSRYMIRTTETAWERGWEVARANFRGAEDDVPCGPSFHNAQRSEDIAAILKGTRWSAAAEEAPLCAVGYSLGGAVLLRYLALEGSANPISAAAAVCPPLDLALCLRALEQPRNILYHRYYVRRQRLQITRKVAEYPERWPPFDRTLNTMRKIDARYVAPDAGYANENAYYAGASALPVLTSVRTPTLLLAAADDPFIPIRLFEEMPRAADSLHRMVTRAGGHCGFLAGALWSGLSFWAAGAVLDWLERGV